MLYDDFLNINNINSVRYYVKRKRYIIESIIKLTPKIACNSYGAVDFNTYSFILKTKIEDYNFLNYCFL